MLAQLCKVLTQTGNPPVVLSLPDGTRLLVLPRGGRLLGLFPPGSEANFLWTNPALASPSQAAAYLRTAAWPNPGGDRTWVAPELGLFVSDPVRPFDTYRVPPALDPGAWQVETGTADRVTLCLQAELTVFRPQARVRVSITRICGPTANPLGGELPAGVSCAGYQQQTAMEVEPARGPGTPRVGLGLWHLLQLPQPGEMLIATRQQTPPTVVFGPAGQEAFAVEPQLLRWRMDGGLPVAKIAVAAAALTGRAGYLWEAPPGTYQLVVRQFRVDPTAQYIDPLWDPPHRTGFAFQACRVLLGSECFNELEYHAPAVWNRAAENRCQDESHVWAFRGPEEAIRKVAAHLLGAA
ncbi:MAG: hypothetical protein AB1505_23060 [Candidatus Latescibacterota bacterium]